MSKDKKNVIIPPYGGELASLITTGEEREMLRREANRYPSLQISDRALHDLELLAVGGYSPLDRFITLCPDHLPAPASNSATIASTSPGSMPWLVSRNLRNAWSASGYFLNSRQT